MRRSPAIGIALNAIPTASGSFCAIAVHTAFPHIIHYQNRLVEITLFFSVSSATESRHVQRGSGRFRCGLFLLSRQAWHGYIFVIPIVDRGPQPAARTLGIVPDFRTARTDAVRGKGVPVMPAARPALPQQPRGGAEITFGTGNSHFTNLIAPQGMTSNYSAETSKR
jgi:hypothetical protein